jgi:general secretion pathway protein J
MTQAREALESGFTLVEMLVALSLFAVLAAAGVGLLRSSVDTQTMVADRVAGSGSLARVQALLANDLSHASALSALPAGAGKPAFIGEAGGFTLLRTGWDNPDGADRSDVQQVKWSDAAGSLARSGNATDAPPGEQARVIAARQTRFRYRLATGGWSDSFAGRLEEPLPQAVEILLIPDGRPPVTMVLALPPRGIDGAPVKPDAALAPPA